MDQIQTWIYMILYKSTCGVYDQVCYACMCEQLYMGKEAQNTYIRIYRNTGSIIQDIQYYTGFNYRISHIQILHGAYRFFEINIFNIFQVIKCMSSTMLQLAIFHLLTYMYTQLTLVVQLVQVKVILILIIKTCCL